MINIESQDTRQIIGHIHDEIILEVPTTETDAQIWIRNTVFKVRDEHELF